jgi:ribosome-associated toxin RatA of RatAB toxin-antitoxin module
MDEPIRRTMTIAAPPERVAAIVADFDSYPKWQKEVAEVQVIERDASGRASHVRMKTEAMGMQTTTEIAVEYGPDKIEYHLVKGDMTTKQDALYVFNRNVAGGTDLELEMAIGLKWSLPAFMINNIVNKGINDNLKAIKRLAEAE